MKKKVYVGISGGVDSAVCAYLLTEQGFDVTGVFLKNWSGDNFGISDNCPWKEDLESAQKVCEHLNIPLKVYNFEKEYRELVIEDFFYQYSIGNTPNPDVLCNKHIKFDKFLARAIDEGADYIATGHYSKTGNGLLFKAKDRNKDQTYFLHQLTYDQLSRSIFPLADLEKNEVREIAKQAGIPNFARKDSQGICFVGKVDIQEFLSTQLKEKEGDIVDDDSGLVVGKHKGVWYYTIGQRKGLHIGGSEIPYFINRKDVETNTIYVVKGKDNPKLWSTTMYINDLHIINPACTLEQLEDIKTLTASIRYRSVDTPCTISTTNESVKIEFATKQWAPAIGQSIVIFNNQECIGGGRISNI